jgi:hypothetical protein
MTQQSDKPSNQKNVAKDGGALFIGNFSGSIANASGQGSYAASFSVGPQDQLIRELRALLTEARRSLEDSHDHRRTTDCEDAVAAIDSLNVELDRRPEDRDAGKLRQRLERLAEKLTPVTGLLTTGSALLDIIIQLKSMV